MLLGREDMQVLGSADRLWRFPVKSMQGEEVTTAHVTERGFVGDRIYALIDTETGKVVSAKNPRKWPGLLEFSARFVHSPAADGIAPPVRVTFPGGTSISNDERGFDAQTSAIFRRDVVIQSTPPQELILEEYWPDIDGLAHREMVTDEAISLGTPAGTFFDFAPIHLLTTSTLAALERAYPQGRFEPRRFRPNILVDTEQEGMPENDWVGRHISIGDEVVLEVVIPCPRCVMTTLPQGDLPHDSGILRTAARENNVMISPLNQKMPSVGVYAKVLRGGDVKQGDAVCLM
jgi:MOSC domain-containing protein